MSSHKKSLSEVAKSPNFDKFIEKNEEINEITKAERKNLQKYFSQVRKADSLIDKHDKMSEKLQEVTY